jgi:prophage antirepressor-like protein
MTDIQIFNNPEFGSIRTIEQNGEPWFVGKDVAEALGYSNASKALADHVDEQDKLNNESLVSLGQRGGWLINESGFYSLCFSSKLEGAKKFKRWVTSEVLPSIRKTGNYMMLKLSKEMQALFLLDQRTVQQEQRITALESSMVVDYGQQQALKNAVNRVVMHALGGKDAPAYLDKSTRDKVYSECNRDIQNWFRVNSRNNIPRKRFDEAVEYIQRWKPSTNTVMMIQQANEQISLFDRRAAV